MGETKRTRKPPPPAGLQKTRGGRLWREIVAIYQLRPDELRILEDACRHVDLVDRLEADVASGELKVAGSKDQEVAHPLLQELRASRLLVKQLFAQLELPDSPERGVAKAGEASWKARHAARARWDRSVG